MSRRTLEEWDGELGCVRRLRACQFFHKMSHVLLVVDSKQFALFVFLVALGTTWLLISGYRFVEECFFPLQRGLAVKDG